MATKIEKLLTEDVIRAYDEAMMWQEGVLPDELQVQPVEFAGSAACATQDRDLFFPQKQNLRTTQAAKEICGLCVQRPACLRWAFHADEWGVWGGLSARDRHLVRNEFSKSKKESPAA